MTNPMKDDGEPELPTIDWLIDQIAPSNSPLLGFNKKRLRELIDAETAKAALEAKLDTLDDVIIDCYNYDNPMDLAEQLDKERKALRQQQGPTNAK